MRSYRDGVTIDALAKHRLTRSIADARWWLIAVMFMFLAIDVIIGERVFHVFAPALLVIHACGQGSLHHYRSHWPR